MNETAKTALQLGGIDVFDDGTIIAGGMRFDAGRVGIRIDDRTQETSHVAPVGVILAVATFWIFLLGLLFLLVRETRLHGYVFVTIEDRYDGRIWVQPLVVNSYVQRFRVFGLFNYFQEIVAYETAKGANYVNS